jgi:NADH:ubiquinone oxidoreductase subunit B-like Fe-S oxidoreductase
MNNEEMMEEKAVEISREQLEKVAGGESEVLDHIRNFGRMNSLLNGPFCLSCNCELTHANGSYKCMNSVCPMKLQPQEGYYR